MHVYVNHIECTNSIGEFPSSYTYYSYVAMLQIDLYNLMLAYCMLLVVCAFF